MLPIILTTIAVMGSIYGIQLPVSPPDNVEFQHVNKSGIIALAGQDTDATAIYVGSGDPSKPSIIAYTDSNDRPAIHHEVCHAYGMKHEPAITKPGECAIVTVEAKECPDYPKGLKICPSSF